MLKKLIMGFFLLILLGIAGVAVMNYYYEANYDKELVAYDEGVFNDRVHFTSELLGPGTYRIIAGGTGIVEDIEIIDRSGNVVANHEETTNLLYGSSNSFVVRVNYAPPNPGEEYEATIEIYRYVEK